MSLARDADAQKLIMKTAEKLEAMEQIAPPEWATFVKTGVHKERPPTQKNWWYIRAASTLRKLHMGSKPVGVANLRKVYGGRKNLGHRPEHKRLASGSITRKILQQLEAAELVKQEKKKGRTITPKGQKLLNSISKELK